MEVLIYSSDKDLPFFRKNPTHPNGIFDPDMMDDWREVHPHGKSTTKSIPKSPERLASSHPLWPMLIALSELDFDAFAHVNVFFENDTFFFSKRTVVVISSTVPDRDSDGIPVIRFEDSIRLIYSPDVSLLFLKHDRVTLGSADFWKYHFQAAVLRPRVESDRSWSLPE